MKTRPLLILVGALLLSPPARAEEVRVLPAGEVGNAYVLPVLNEYRIVVHLYDPRQTVELSLLSDDWSHGQHIENILWSPGNKFLVLTTSSVGGHSPWNFKTYIFSSTSRSFLCLDDVVAPVTSSTFTFLDSSHLTIETLKSPTSPVEERATRTIDLDFLPWKTPLAAPTPTPADN